MTGVARLGRAGVVAADMKRSMLLGSCDLQFLRQDAAGGDRRAGDLAALGSATHRVRSVGGVLYGAGPGYGGTSWARIGKAPGGAALYGDQIIDVFDLGTLRALVASESSSKPGSAVHDADDRAVKKTWSIRGTTTFGRAVRALQAVQDDARRAARPPIPRDHRLLGDRHRHDGKADRGQAVWRPGAGYPSASVAVATRFSWDVKASIKAPRAGRTARDPHGDDVVDLVRS
ncbi:hypothetical protein [Microbispora bryophytorum]|uniref:hypothetical protein n=1 Tax=Microbispora bryophytorum TaxID=1460882 RepID=UPI0033DF3F55